VIQDFDEDVVDDLALGLDEDLGSMASSILTSNAPTTFESIVALVSIANLDAMVTWEILKAQLMLNQMFGSLTIGSFPWYFLWSMIVVNSLLLLLFKPCIL
jgi:hypothetical protein